MSIKKSAEYSMSIDAGYVAAMAEIKRAQNNVPPTPLRKMTEEDIQAMQSPATRANLNSTKPRDWNAPYPKEAKANPDAEAVFASLGHRPQDIHLSEFLRKSGRNEEGQSEKSIVTAEQKAKAVDKFMATSGVKYEDLSTKELRTVGLIEFFKRRAIPEEKWKTVSPLKALWHWLRGDKVKRVDDEK